MSVKNQYRSNRWVEFREKRIKLDEGACVRCGKTREQGAVLQVHHKEYWSGKAPWEYPFELCETLCKGCHAEEHGEIPPRSGWEYVGEEDLGGLYGTCDLCYSALRYVFFVQHPKWEPMGVGTVCCDNLTGTQIASDKRKYENRLKQFIKSKQWRVEADGHRITRDKIAIQVVPVEGGYRLKMNSTEGKNIYPSLNAAKTKAFEFVESGEAEGFFAKRLVGRVAQRNHTFRLSRNGT
ncbi:hypothetical protein [Methylomicrobium lacus]|uniref:hypothetical protein n=1 Tax=Methylomicrobium lacus TaxID=136992 RepID=UPI0035A83CE9